MKHWSDFLEEAGEYSAIRRALRQPAGSSKGAVGIFGCIDAAKGHMVHGLGRGYDFRILITADEQKAYDQAVQTVSLLKSKAKNDWELELFIHDMVKKLLIFYYLEC